MEASSTGRLAAKKIGTGLIDTGEKPRGGMWRMPKDKLSSVLDEKDY